MPRTRDQRASAHFAKVRGDHSTETAEDYVEAVDDILRDRGECRVRDLAKHMGVSHVTVTRIVSRLQEEGLLSQHPYQPVFLTPQGEQLAIALGDAAELSQDHICGGCCFA